MRLFKSRATAKAALLVALVAANLLLGRTDPVYSSAGSDCLGGDGYGGIADGPYDTDAWCSTQQDYCIEAQCRCGSPNPGGDLDRHCISELVCNGYCAGGG
jgi:hypothetical protein